ncbi:MAG: right-handed parallel beta-helix repeat-containing protein, partial [Candidatus Limnocylindrales bacterium]
IVSDWLEARTVQPPHGSLAAALERASATPQRRHRWLPWRFDRGSGASGDGSARDGRGEHDRRGGRRLSSATVAAAAATVAVIALAAIVGQGRGQPVVPVIGGATHYVAETDGAFRTIGEAVLAAEDGDTVLVAPGTYEEALIIDKDITLVSSAEPPREVVLLVPEDAPDPVVPLSRFDPRADRFELPERVPVGIQLIDSDATLRGIRVIGRGDSIALLVSGGAPVLEGLVLKHEGGPLLETALAGALFIEGGSTASVRDAHIWQRVRIAGGSSPTISDSQLSGVQLVVQEGSSPVFTDNSIDGGCGCDDVTVVGGSTPVFEGNTFVFGGMDVVGLDDDGTGAHLEGNRFSAHDADALSISGGASATVLGNSFYGNNQGVRVSGASADVRGNEFVGNWNAVMLSATDATLSDNNIRGGEIGVSVGDGSSATISGNVIENVGTRGIYVADGTSPTIDANTICGSTSNLVVGPAASPVLGSNEICADREVAAG